MRIGQGFDVHKLVPGKGMVLGGINIPSKFSIEAYSDGDIILHALSDALLGAAALGDLGNYFPSTEPEFKNISSREILKQVATKIIESGYKIENIDITFVGEEPKLSNYTKDICQRIGDDLSLNVNQVSCKATTTDGLGFEGSLLGVSCYAITLLSKSP